MMKIVSILITIVKAFIQELGRWSGENKNSSDDDYV